MPLDPALEALLAQMAAAEGPAMTEVPPADAREMYRGMQALVPRPDIHHVEDADADGIPVRIYRANDDVTPCIIYFHGGGWVIGDLDTHDGVCRQLAEATGFTVVSVHYRLAPEAPFPAPLDDCYRATEWVVANADRLRIDASRIAVAGDSAGGNLGAAVSLKARDENGPAIHFQALIYPVTATAMDTPSYVSNAEGYLLTRDTMEWFFSHYIGHDPALEQHHLVAPLLAEDLSGMPSALIITAEFDPLRDEGEAFGERLQAAGVDVTVRRYDGMTHAFFGLTEMLEGARDAMALTAAELKRALG